MSTKRETTNRAGFLTQVKRLADFYISQGEDPESAQDRALDEVPLP